MPKESDRRHHYVPRSYLRRFASGKKKRLLVQEVEDGSVIRTFRPNVSSFLVECGIYDLGPYLSGSSSFPDTGDGFLEDIVFARVHEPLFSKSLKQTIDLNLVPDTQACKGIIQGIWTLYLRTPRVRRINSLVAEEVTSEIDENRRRFLNSFGMVTAKTILKLFPRTLAHTKAIFLNAIGESRFLTTDNPSIPCHFDEQCKVIQTCDQIHLQRSVILADEWPSDVALLCPLSPRWCILAFSVEDLSSINYRQVDSHSTDRLNHFIRGSADRFVILAPDG
jgi:hypothetical protein